MNAEIITVGTELLLGDILNSNSQFLSKELAALGVSVLHQSTVGDNVERLKTELQAALSRSDLLIVTGGLGPTQDDLTRETVAEVLGLPMELDEASLTAIRAYFARTGRDMPQNNEKQAMLPKGSTVFQNDFGTAPGSAVEQNGKIVVMLPGPPRELIPMFTERVVPYLATFSDGVIVSKNVHVFGIGESTVAERCADLMEGANPTVAPYAKQGEVTLRVTARAATREQADALCDPVVADIEERLGGSVYLVGDGNLQTVVVSLLKEHGKKIATAESCTAGLLSGRLTEVAGASEVFDCGIASYSNEIKHQVLGVPADMLETYGAVSAETVCAMAIGARRVGNADIGVGISGVAGPAESEGKPVGTVYVAISDGKRVWVKKITAGRTTDREQIRYLATSHALDLVRRYLTALPNVMAGGVLLKLGQVKPIEPEIPSAPVEPKKNRGMGGILPWRGSAASRTVKTIVWILLLLGVFVACMFTDPLLPYWNDTALYRALFPSVSTGGDYLNGDVDEPTVPSATPEELLANAPDGMLDQFDTLYVINDDVRGWLTVPGTGIDTPVMQSQDETFYETHDFYGEDAAVGTPFFSRDASFYSIYSDNRVLQITGSNVAAGQGFADLLAFADADFTAEHITLQMDTLFETAKWEVFAVAIVAPEEGDEAFDLSKHPHSDDEKFLTFISDLQTRSLFNVSVEPDVTDQLLLLDTDVSTATAIDGARLVIAAKKVYEATEEIIVEKNENALLPAGYQGLTVSTTTSPSGGNTTEKLTTVIPSASTTSTTSSTTTTTTTEESTTTTTKKSSTSKTTSTTKKTTTTVKPSSTTTKKTTTTTKKTTTTTKPTTGTTLPPSPAAPKTPVKVTDKVEETERFKNFRVFGKGKESGELPHSTKEEVQLALSKLVLHEVGSSKTPTEAIKAQAVAAYSYVLYHVEYSKSPYTVTFTKTFDPNGSATEKRIYKAVGEVLGEKLLDVKTGKHPYISYFAVSAGVTASNHEVFGAKLPHLMSVDSSVETVEMCKKYLSGKTAPAYSQSRFTHDQVIQKLSDYMDEEIFIDGDTFAPTTFAATGKYVLKTNAYYKDGRNKVYITGRQVRGALELRSHAFEVEYDGDNLTVTCYGWGHGVGMSQLGAMVYAGELGWTYDQILAHYFSIDDKSAVQLVSPNWGDEK